MRTIQVGINYLLNNDTLSLKEEFEKNSWLVYIFEGTGIVSKESFFNKIKNTLPLDPPLGDYNVWDALQDSLFGGIDLLESKKICIIWDNHQIMENAAAKDYKIILEIFEEVAGLLKDDDVTCGSPKDFAIILV